MHYILGKTLKFNTLTNITTHLLSMIFKVKSYEKNKFIRKIENLLQTDNVRKKFIIEIIFLILSIKGRINFLQLERFGKHTERMYRLNFEERFDFMKFNKNIVLQKVEENMPSHLTPAISVNPESALQILDGFGLVVPEHQS